MNKNIIPIHGHSTKPRYPVKERPARKGFIEIRSLDIGRSKYYL